MSILIGRGDGIAEETRPRAGEQATNDGNPKISVEGLAFEWDVERGTFLVGGAPTVCMWIETTMAGFMAGLQKMVGTERFNLALEAGGRDSIEGDWKNIIQPSSKPEDGLRLIGRCSPTAGLGGWEVVSFDYEKKEAQFRGNGTSWEVLYQKALGVCWGTNSLAGKLEAYCTRIFGVNCRTEQISFAARGDAYDEFVVRPSDRTIEADLEGLIASGKATSEDLAIALRELNREVQERRMAEARLAEEIQQRREVEEELRLKLALIKRQEDAIRALSTPILQIWEGVLTLPMIGIVDSMRAAQIMEGLLERVTETRARFAILDLTGVEIMDTSAANHLLKLVRATALLGSRCLLSGISPRMASTIVGLGLNLDEVATFGTLEAALRHAIQRRYEEKLPASSSPL